MPGNLTIWTSAIRGNNNCWAPPIQKSPQNPSDLHIPSHWPHLCSVRPQFLPLGLLLTHLACSSFFSGKDPDFVWGYNLKCGFKTTWSQILMEERSVGSNAKRWYILWMLRQPQRGEMFDSCDFQEVYIQNICFWYPTSALWLIHAKKHTRTNLSQLIDANLKSDSE